MHQEQKRPKEEDEQQHYDIIYDDDPISGSVDKIDKPTASATTSSSLTVLSILVLGDGDFSWSLDLGRYLSFMMSSSSSLSCEGDNYCFQEISKHSNNLTTVSSPCSNIMISLRATGIDSSIEVAKKYPHSSTFIIPELLKLDNDKFKKNSPIMDYCHSTKSEDDGERRRYQQQMKQQKVVRLDVQVIHKVNAIVGDDDGYATTCRSTNTKLQNEQRKTTNDSSRNHMNHDEQDDYIGQTQQQQIHQEPTMSSIRNTNNVVIFNHPHLGVENAVLHNQFINHLLDSVKKHWWYQKEDDDAITSNDTATSTTTCCNKEEKLSLRLQLETKSSNKTSNNNHRITAGRISDEKEPIKLLYLTLAPGQFERWNCSQAAKKHGFRLIRKCRFVPHPNINVNIIDCKRGGLGSLLSSSDHCDNDPCVFYYEQRRHQCGKSFARRITGPSETYIYTCMTKIKFNVDDLNKVFPFHLPWFQQETDCDTDDVAAVMIDSNPENFNGNKCTKTGLDQGKSASQPSFSCPHCGKMFHERRSVKNHIISKHGTYCNHSSDGSIIHSRKRKKESSLLFLKTGSSSDNNSLGYDHVFRQDDDDIAATTTTPITQRQLVEQTYTCSLCESDVSCPSIKKFATKEALRDHLRAKHYGLHKTVKPDWIMNKDPTTTISVSKGGVIQGTSSSSSLSINTNSDQRNSSHSCCDVCGFIFTPTSNISLIQCIHQHWQQFIPLKDEVQPKQHSADDDNLPTVSTTIQCQFCFKKFQQNRAKLQHENFCKNNCSVDSDGYMRDD